LPFTTHFLQKDCD